MILLYQNRPPNRYSDSYEVRSSPPYPWTDKDRCMYIVTAVFFQWLTAHSFTGNHLVVPLVFTLQVNIVIL